MKYIESRIFNIDTKNINENALKEISEGLSKGKIVIFPTETVYGIGALCDQTDSIKKICEIKGRNVNKPFAFYINNVKKINETDFILPEYYKDIIKKFWPGPLTLILRNKNNETQGFRFTENHVTIELLKYLPNLLKATSANKSGESCITNSNDILMQFKNKVDYIINSGNCKYNEESTVLDLSVRPCVVARKGVIWKELSNFLNEKSIDFTCKKKILVVCTGNTCRSPMLRGILIDKLTRSNLINYFDVDSCGVYSPFSISPSKYAIDVLADDGIDISSYRSKSITQKLIRESDKIIVMTKEHEIIIKKMSSDLKENILVLNVTDPIGKGYNFYRETYCIIKRKLKEIENWIQK